MDPNNNNALNVLAEICATLPYLTVNTPNVPQKRKPRKRSASANNQATGLKKRRTKLNISLETLYDQTDKKETATLAPEAPLAQPLQGNDIKQ